MKLVAINRVGAVLEKSTNVAITRIENTIIRVRLEMMNKKLLIISFFVFAYLLFGFNMAVQIKQSRPMVCSTQITTSESIEPDLSTCKKQNISTLEEIEGILYLMLFWPYALAVAAHG